MSYTYAVAGSDARQFYTAQLLEQRGFSVIRCRELPFDAQTILLPIPAVGRDGLIPGTQIPFSRALSSLSPGTVLWGTGMKGYEKEAADAGVILRNYTDFDAFAEKNAIPTAEGAVQLAMEQLPTTINGSRFLVIGYGRIGKHLAQQLRALGGAVTVARREGAADDFRTDRTGAYRLPLAEYDAIFNTVPFPVLEKEHCDSVREDCLLVDLASMPGGICKSSGRTVIHASGLPAKTAPKTAAAILLSIILNETEELSWNN